MKEERDVDINLDFEDFEGKSLYRSLKGTRMIKRNLHIIVETY